jgi:hypothetical protein
VTFLRGFLAPDLGKILQPTDDGPIAVTLADFQV